MPKMKRATIVKFSLDELAGVDAGAQAEAGTVVLKRRDERPSTMVSTAKRAAITSAVLGHTHLVNGIDDMQSGCTTSERVSEAGVHSDSYSSYHSHPWVRMEDGSIVLGEAAGHTHDIAVTAASLAVTTAVKSTRATEAQKVTSMSKIVVLTEAQGAHYSKLTGTDAETFIAKSALERDVEVTKAREADPIVFTGEVTKMEVRRSDGPRFLELAKQNEANAVASKRSLEMAETEKAAREWSEVVKRASTIMGNLAGTDDDHGRLLQNIERETDVAKRDAMIATLKAADALMVGAGKAKGANPGTDAESGNPVEVWNGEVAKFAAKREIKDLGKAEDLFLGTPEGLVAKRAYDKASAEIRRAQDF